MSRYGKIESGFWHNPKVRGVSERGKFLLLYLYSCPHGNAVGCFVMHDGYVAADLGWAIETVSETLSELFEKGFLERDEGSFLLRVVGWWGHNPIDNPNVAKFVAKELLALPNCKVKQQAIDDVLNFDGWSANVRQTLSERLGKPSRNQEHNNSIQEQKKDAALSRAPDAELFERGKAVLGKTAGGLIASLLRAKGGSVPLARAAIEQASTKQNAREYIGRIIKGQEKLPAEQPDWDRLVREYRETNNNRWPLISGPAPDYSGCKAPREILVKYGYINEPSAA